MGIDPDVADMLRPIQEGMAAMQADIAALKEQIEGGGQSEAEQLFWELLPRAANELDGSDELWSALNATLERVLGQ